MTTVLPSPRSKPREMIKQNGEQILFEGDRKQVYAGSDNPLLQNCVSVLCKHFPKHSWRDGFFLLCIGTLRMLLDTEIFVVSLQTGAHFR